MNTLQNPSAEPPKEGVSLLKKPFFYSSIVAICLVLYVAFVMYARFTSDQAVTKRNEVKAAEERRANDLATIQQLGGSDLAIQSLYVAPGVIHPGEKAQLCYDVANAKTVTLDPPAGEVWPSHTRCLDVSPKKTTTYTLTIADAKGQSKSQTVELKVEEQGPIHIKSFPSN
jgi:hypothetical protein